MGELIDNLKSFRSGVVQGTSDDPLIVAKDVVATLGLMSSKISFSLLYLYTGTYHVYGYAYGNSTSVYGTIHIDFLGGGSSKVKIINSVYTEIK